MVEDDKFENCDTGGCPHLYLIPEPFYIAPRTEKFLPTYYHLYHYHEHCDNE
jgi:hypothetical protein